ncbi:MAG: prolyl oligopeptidase family serine peptidase [Pirellula sp.]
MNVRLGDADLHKSSASEMRTYLLMRNNYTCHSLSIMRLLFIAFVLYVLFPASWVGAQLRTDGATASFMGSLPPKKTVDLPQERIAQLQARLLSLQEQFSKVRKHPRAADAEIFIKAVRYAIEFQEWYDKKPEDTIQKVGTLLDEAQRRIEGLGANQTVWLNGTGQKVVGFYSDIDGSPQPYGVEIPDGLEYGRAFSAVPMWIWLHGRGDTTTDLNFVYSRLTNKKPGQFQPKGTVVIHPFGRYCNGWKSAGETDVLEAMRDASMRFNIDANRVVIAGFSMGGAGAWHMGAHFADRWACVHTGAGFVDVKRYQKLTPEKMPVWYEQKLWGLYDVPNYVRNFTNVPLVCYSGEIDPQRDSAEYMIEELAKIGLKPPHLIGPETGHKYHPEILKEVQSRIEAAVAQGRNRFPTKVTLQTRTLAYNRMHWLEIRSLEKQWEDATVEAELDGSSKSIRISTKNVDGLSIELPKDKIGFQVSKVVLNGIDVPIPAVLSDRAKRLDSQNVFSWEWGRNQSDERALTKKPSLQGPIDDGLKSKFVVVLPDTPQDGSAIDRWVEAESSHFLVRWRALMRGDAIVLKPDELTEQISSNAHLVLWGTPKSNSLIRKLFKDERLASVLKWTDQNVQIGSHVAAADSSVPVMCYPNPMATDRYIILNSGLTFRESHDRTNSLQNPKLPDWAILDISQPPDSASAGKVLFADFFDNHWKP